MSTETVRFNVGGNKYEVSRSLLNMHPDTMLARSASEQWQEDPESEIFIERNGVIFQYVLDFLRDSHVSLPLTVTKDALLQELQYYGAQLEDESTIDESSARGFQLAAGVQNMKEEGEVLKNQAQESDMRSVFHDFARTCFGEYVKKLSLTVCFCKSMDQAGYKLAERARNLYGSGAKKDCLNTYMSKVGLKFLRFGPQFPSNTPRFDAYLELVNSEEDV